MGISTTQYRDIMYEYDQQRMKNQRIMDQRFEKIAKQIPEISEIQNQLIHLSIQQARAELLSPQNAALSLKHYHSCMQALIEKKASLLSEHGYPSDYLSPIYTCPDCRDTGYIDSSPCHCLLQAEAAILHQNSNLEEILTTENFETFSAAFYDDNIIDENLSMTARQNILKIETVCRQFIDDFDKEYDNLIFYGPTGVGKTFMTHCIAKDLLDSGHSVIYLTSLQLFAILEKNTFRRNSQEAGTDEQVTCLLHCDLLIVDDLGTELTNNFTNSQLYYFIEERHLKKRSTIFSTNIAFHDLHARYGERIFSRFTGYYHFYKIIGRDIRPLKRLQDSIIESDNNAPDEL